MVMKNHYLSEWRRAWRVAPWSDEDAAAIPSTNNPEASSDLERVLAFMDTLSETTRGCVMDIALGHTYEETAKRNKLKVGTVKSRVTRARVKIREFYEGDARV